MIRIDLHFLAGRFHATPWGRHVNEGEPEWPPSPWRLLRALISSWKRTAPELTEEQVQSVLQKLATPPSFHLPRAVAGHTRHYMPQQSKNLLVHDPFIAIQRGPDGEPEPLSILWPSESLESDEQTVLTTLLKGLSYFGRAESWCEAELKAESIEPNSRLTAGSNESDDPAVVQNLLCPVQEVTLEQLMVETSELQKKGYNRPPGSAFLSYRRKSDALSPGLQRKTYQTPKKHAAVFLMQAKVLPKKEEVINISTWARIAVNGQFGRQNNREPSACFTGKRNGQSRQEQHQHAFFFAQSSTLQQQGKLDRLVIYAPEGFNENEIKALQSMRTMPDYRRQSQSKDAGVKSRIRLIPLALLDKNEVSKEYHTSKVWVSQTPYLCGRHPKKHRDGPAEQIKRECELRGLGKVTVVEDPTRSANFLKTWRASQLKRWGKPAPPDRPRSFTLTFETEVTGPLCLGASSHFGMGRFIPLDSSN